MIIGQVELYTALTYTVSLGELLMVDGIWRNKDNVSQKSVLLMRKAHNK